MSIDITPAFIKQAIIQRKHFDRVLREWRKGLVALFAGEDLEPYIMKYSEHENEGKLTERRQKAVFFYKNLVKRIHNQYVEAVYAKAGPVVRVTQNGVLQKWFDTQYANWIKRDLVRHQLALPEQYIRVRPCQPADKGYAFVPETVADVNEMELVPAPLIIDPEFVQNFKQDETGALEWITIIHDTVNDKGDACKHFEILTRRDRIVVDEQGVEVEPPAPHGFTRCPIIRMVYEENRLLGSCVGHAFMADTVSLALANLNIDAMAVEAIVAHLSPKLVTDSVTAEGIVKNGIGAHNVIIEGDGSPQAVTGVTRYLQQNGFEIKTLLQLSYTDLVSQIMEEARLRDRTQTTDASGLAKLLDSEPEEAVIKDVAAHFADYDQQICDLLCEAYQNGITCTVTYPDYDAAKSGAGDEGNGLIGRHEGAALIADLQVKYFAGQISRDAAVANLVTVFGLSEMKARKLFPEKAPEVLTPTEAMPATGDAAPVKSNRGGLREKAPTTDDITPKEAA